MGYDSDHRDFGLLTLVPELPIFTWLARFDTGRDPACTGPAVLDLSKAALHGPGLRALVQAMQERGLRIVGLTGLDAARIGDQAAQLPPILPVPGAARPAPPAAPTPTPQPASMSLLIEGHVRSGQRIQHPHGDVSVVGTVSSGAEILAAGSVHVYGVLRGRASAGTDGGPAQIFCQRLEAELLAINGVLLVADDMAPRFLGRAVRAVREGETVSLRDLG